METLCCPVPNIRLSYIENSPKIRSSTVCYSSRIFASVSAGNRRLCGGLNLSNGIIFYVWPTSGQAPRGQYPLGFGQRRHPPTSTYEQAQEKAGSSVITRPVIEFNKIIFSCGRRQWDQLINRLPWTTTRGLPRGTLTWAAACKTRAGLQSPPQPAERERETAEGLPQETTQAAVRPRYYSLPVSTPSCSSSS